MTFTVSKRRKGFYKSRNFALSMPEASPKPSQQENVRSGRHERSVEADFQGFDGKL